MSGYFVVFLLAILLWRLWQFAFAAISGDNATETFAYIVVKEPV